MTTVLVDDIWLWVRFVGQNLMKNSLCFFRGQSNAQWVIKSTFERECCMSDKSDLAHGVTFAEMRLRAQERRLLTQFVRDGWKYTSGNFSGNLTMVEWYSLMRHYVESSKAKKAVECCGGWCVDAEVVVRQQGKDEGHGFFWYLWQCLVWIVCIFFAIIWWILKAIWWVVCAIFGLIF